MNLGYLDLHLTMAVRRHDAELAAYRGADGVARVYRSNKGLDGKDSNQLVTSLTHDWSTSGRRTEWGVDSVLDRLNELDVNVRGGEVYSRIVEERERLDRDEARMRENEARAVAADIRRDVARAFNDFNLSTVDKKIDPRRTKGA